MDARLLRSHSDSTQGAGAPARRSFFGSWWKTAKNRTVGQDTIPVKVVPREELEQLAVPEIPKVEAIEFTHEEREQLQAGTMPDSLFIDGEFDPRKGPSLYKELMKDSSTVVNALIDKLKTSRYSVLILPMYEHIKIKEQYIGMWAHTLAQEDFNPRQHSKDMNTIENLYKASVWLEEILKRNSINEHNIHIVIDNLFKIRRTIPAKIDMSLVISSI